MNNLQLFIDTRLDTLRTLRHDLANVAAIIAFSEQEYDFNKNVSSTHVLNSTSETHTESNIRGGKESIVTETLNNSSLELLNGFLKTLDKTILYYSKTSSNTLFNFLEKNIKNFPDIQNLENVENLKLYARSNVVIAKNFKKLLKLQSIINDSMLVLDLELTNAFLENFNLILNVNISENSTQTSTNSAGTFVAHTENYKNYENDCTLFLQKIVKKN